MKKQQLILTVGSVIFGVALLLVSLLASAQTLGNKSGGITDRRFYVGTKILPDHILYPFVMIADRVLLATTTGEARVLLQINLAKDRMFSAQQLMASNQEELAVSTLTKSQKYLLLAATEYVQLGNDSTVAREALIIALEDTIYHTVQIQSQLQIVDPSVVADLLIQSQAVLTTLSNSSLN